MSGVPWAWAVPLAARMRPESTGSRDRGSKDAFMVDPRRLAREVAQHNDRPKPLSKDRGSDTF